MSKIYERLMSTITPQGKKLGFVRSPKLNPVGLRIAPGWLTRLEIPRIVDSLLLVFSFFLLHDEMTLAVSKMPCVLSSSVKIKLSSLLVHYYIILMLSCK